MLVITSRMEVMKGYTRSLDYGLYPLAWPRVGTLHQAPVLGENGSEGKTRVEGRPNNACLRCPRQSPGTLPDSVGAILALVDYKVSLVHRRESGNGSL